MMWWSIVLLTLNVLTSISAQITQEQISSLNQQHLTNLGKQQLINLGQQHPVASLGQQQYANLMQQQHLAALNQKQLNKQLLQQQLHLQNAGPNKIRWPVGKPQYPFKVPTFYNRPQNPYLNSPNIFGAVGHKMPVYRPMGMKTPAIASASALHPFYKPAGPQNPPGPPFPKLMYNPLRYTNINHVTTTPIKNSLNFSSYPNGVYNAQMPLKNLQHLQSPINNLHAFQNPLKNTLSLTSPIKNSLNLQTSSKNIHALQNPTKNIPTLQNPYKNFNNLQNPSKPLYSTPISSHLNSNINQYVSPISLKPSYVPTYNSLSQTIVKTEPKESFLLEHAVSHVSQVHNTVGSPQKTVIYPVQSEGEKGPIRTIPAPNLGLSNKPIIVPDTNNYIESHSSFFSHQAPTVTNYEVTESTADKTYKDHFSGITKLYAPDPDPSLYPGKLPPTQQFSSVIKTPSSHDSVFKPQQAGGSLTSQELYQLLNGVPLHQNPDNTYSSSVFQVPQSQQPQLQQHLLQQTFDGSTPLQPYNAIIQPVHGDVENIQQSVLFKPDPKYVQKVQEQFFKQGTSFQPNYQTFNYEEPKVAESNHADTGIQQDSLKNHYNFVRNTQEGAIAENNKVASTNSTNQNNQDPSIYNSNNVNDSTKQRNSYSEITPHKTAYFTQVKNVDSESTNYFSTLTSKEISDTLATLTAANNLASVSKPSESDYTSNLQAYFAQNTPSNNQYQYDEHNSGAFTPIQSSLTITPGQGQSSEGSAPINIFVPDQYDDIDTQSSENIRISASMNTNGKNKDGVGSYAIVGVDNQAEYEDYSQVSKINKNTTNSDTSDSKEKSQNQSNDVIVTLQKNNTHPAVDIFTKDWKTSIVIQSKDSKDNTSAANSIPSFGNRLRPKRSE